MGENIMPTKSNDFEALMDLVSDGKQAQPGKMQVEIYGDYFEGISQKEEAEADENESFNGSETYSTQEEEESQNDPKNKWDIPFPCSFCDAVLYGIDTFERHLKMHRSGMKHRCEICGVSFPTAAALRKHMQTHCYKCVFCDQMFQKKNAFLNHVRVHTRESVPEEIYSQPNINEDPVTGETKKHCSYAGRRIFRCSICDVSFSRKYHLAKHMALHKKEEKEFMKKSQMKTRNPAKASRLEDIIKNVRSQNKDKNCKCTTCGDSFTRKEDLQRHELLHSSVEPFICNVCNKPFAKKNYLKIHMQVHAKREIYRCVKEGPDFSQVMSPDRSYKSRVCERDFWLKEDTFQHSRLPVKLRPFKCSSCEKTFSRRSDLNRHEKGHTNEKLYHCQFCNKAFSRKDNLATHMRIYTQERPHKCGICDKAFTRKADMHQHMNTHRKEKPYVCDLPDCPKTFTRKSDLSRHKRQVHKLENH